MPDHTPDLEPLIAQWIEELGDTEPSLAPHLDEIADHIRSSVEARVASGDELDVAFAAAVERFGAPRDLAREFAKSAHLPGRVLGWLADDRHTTRGDLTLAGAWIGMSLVWALAMIVTPLVGAPLEVNWMLVGWFTTTFGPLTAIDLQVKRIRAATTR